MPLACLLFHFTSKPVGRVFSIYSDHRVVAGIQPFYFFLQFGAERFVSERKIIGDCHIKNQIGVGNA